ncbi:hypothetical protein [Ligilactobacillus murinus]|uniref:Uncharacterized protein n=1 Tax=Ligilactobacillus murinus TaxID=1622 RepID=A0AAD0L3V5_9LACO|nr:hypothetical protein [Ligilactobacillus murinus]HBV49113.1 hypothetical protein [Lactobacillus sp.]AWZ38395.1 hypothetical protein CPS94_05255 [Ligilactobacillus murinus]AWZ40615.1 hypothetical protein CPQ89_06210 [Ligilactobacillus murinus]MCR1889861.1 hypothetical protein [Ligilactobacillus murinus]HCM78597.1 hypothetical protein [Lactobacillus sp.]
MIFNKKKNMIALVMVSLIIVVLLGENQLTIVKETELVREVLAQKFPSETEKRRRIALWVVQHFEGPEPIKTIEVGKIESYGFLGTGGKGVSVRINKKEYNEVALVLSSDDIPSGGVGGISAQFEYKYVDKLNSDLDGIEVLYWR